MQEAIQIQSATYRLEGTSSSLAELEAVVGSACRDEVVTSINSFWTWEAILPTR
jgi:hypothetical protein